MNNSKLLEYGFKSNHDKPSSLLFSATKNRKVKNSDSNLYKSITELSSKKYMLEKEIRDLEVKEQKLKIKAKTRSKSQRNSNRTNNLRNKENLPSGVTVEEIV